MTYPRETLGSLSEMIDYGFTASASALPVGPKFLRITDIQNGNVAWNSVPYCECSNGDSEQHALKPGDIVFARTGATTGKSFLIRDCPAGAVFASYLIRVRPSKRLDPGFLAHFFKTPQYWQQITKHSAGSTQPGVNSTKLKELIVPVPPFAEQKRIAGIMDQADALRRKRQHALQLADDLPSSLFFEMFGDPRDNPGAYSILNLEDICKDVTDGTHLAPEWSSSGVPFLFVSNIRNGKLRFETDKYITEGSWFELTKNCPIELGDILYTTVGSYGHAAMVDTKERFCFQRHVAQLKPDPSKVLPVFLLGLMLSPGIKRQADMEARGIAQKTINLRELRKL